MSDIVSNRTRSEISGAVQRIGITRKTVSRNCGDASAIREVSRLIPGRSFNNSYPIIGWRFMICFFARVKACGLVENGQRNANADSVQSGGQSEPLYVCIGNDIQGEADRHSCHQQAVLNVP
ncbi:hypothetical protein LJR220_001430 [Bradyrhizobium sp. LjRoot220]|uniref:hypothetical protein n=1 Tax=Bradyrhizobium sp. LjRoot220 TaxID=3342284 RepID=UPI003ED04382